MQTTHQTPKLNLFNSIYDAQSLWRTFKNLLLIVEKVRWFVIAILVTIAKNFFLDKNSSAARYLDFYMFKYLLALLGVKMNSRDRETLRFAKKNKAIFLTNLSSSIDPLITRY